MNITHFMWGYQPHFRIGRQCAAESVFRMLNPAFDPEVFLVGILADSTADGFPACVEPENDFWSSRQTIWVFPAILRTYTASPQFRPTMETTKTSFLCGFWTTTIGNLRTREIQLCASSTANRTCRAMSFR